MEKVWRGRFRPRTLATRTADRSLLSLVRRSEASRGRRGHLRGIRPGIRKERCAQSAPGRTGSTPRSLQGADSGPGPGRDYSGKCEIMPGSRSRRNRRDPYVSRARHQRRGGQSGSKILRVPYPCLRAFCEDRVGILTPIRSLRGNPATPSTLPQFPKPASPSRAAASESPPASRHGLNSPSLSCA